MKTSFRVPLIYERQKSNIGYDANLRRSMELASGDYLFVLGNDDALNDHQAIDQLVTSIWGRQSWASYLQLPGNIRILQLCTEGCRKNLLCQELWHQP